MNYLPISKFQLNQDFIKSLSLIDWQNLDLAFRVDRKAALEYFFKNYRVIDYLDFVHSYGLTFGKVAVLDTYILPKHVEQTITQEVNKFFGRSFNDLVIRLQVAHGGEVVPIHKDPTRTASLVYPLDHHSFSSTVFYDAVLPTNNREGLLNPKQFKIVDSICIDKNPVLLDVKRAHAVFLSNLYTVISPRLSLSIKWKTVDFESLVKCLD